jgi:hypothetical protein
MIVPLMGFAEQYYLLGSNAVWSVSSQTFRRKTLHPSSGSKVSQVSSQQGSDGRRNVGEFLSDCKILHPRNIIFFIVAAVGTSNPSSVILDHNKEICKKKIAVQKKRRR